MQPNTVRAGGNEQSGLCLRGKRSKQKIVKLGKEGSAITSKKFVMNARQTQG